jgi:glycosyltransferase involved in cell wall biosynthesis
MKKVLQMMFFSADRAYNYYQEGNEHQLHNLYGYDRLKNEKDFYVECIHSKAVPKVFNFNQKIKRFILEFNLIILQLRCSIKSKNFDVIYVPHDFHLIPLAILRILGICKKPILLISHFAYNPKYINKKTTKIYRLIERYFIYRGIDKILFLNETILKAATSNYNVPQRHRDSFNWGANLNFFQKYIDNKNEPTKNAYFMSLGSQNRDFDILIKAFTISGKQLRIYSKCNHSDKLPSNIVIDESIEPGIDSVAKLRSCYYDAIAVLIPLKRSTDISNGTSVIIEALAMGKPIIITDFDINYIDVEAENIGFKVKPGDVMGWVNAIEWLIQNPIQTKEMGERSLKLAKERYNYELFSEKLVSSIISLSDNSLV